MDDYEQDQALSRGYWRSLEAVARDPELMALLEKDPAHPSHDSNGMSRKDFVSLMGAALAMVGLAGCRKPVEKIVPYVIKPEELTPGIAEHYATAMGLGTETRFLLAESHEGRPTYLAGNPLDEFTGGAADVWAIASILNLYDPDRSRWPAEQGEQRSFDDVWALLKELHSRHLDSQGEGLAILSEGFASPTLSRLAGAFSKRFPKARWVTYEPVGDENIREGIASSTGQAAAPFYHFESAEIVLSVDADFLGAESLRGAYAKAFTQYRSADSNRAKMNRLYLVESSLSSTAVMADHRRSMSTGDMERFLHGLGHTLIGRGLSVPGGDVWQTGHESTPGDDWLEPLADELLAHRGSSLIVVGRHLEPRVHGMALALNEALGNVGKTVHFTLDPHTSGSDRNALADLVAAMNKGQVQSLVMLGGNPVFNAPGRLNFANALTHVEETVHLSSHVDETSTLTAWHVPRLHYLESWGDVSTPWGALGISQPLIAPLYQGTSAEAVLHAVTTGEVASAHDLVRGTWHAILGTKADKPWRKVLHDGIHKLSRVETIPVKVVPGRLRGILRELAQASRAGKLELVLQPSRALHDGRFANNGWLQEFPDPVTKITWDNVVLVSPAAARRMKLRQGEMVRLSAGGRHIDIPVWIMPGQADGTVTTSLGYGRTRAGRVGNRVGTDTYPLLPETGYIQTAVSLRKTGRVQDIACVQDHHGLDEESFAAEGIQERLPVIVRESTLDGYQKNPTFAQEMVEHPPLESLWEEHRYDEGYQWGMAVDLNLCIGCGACTVACQSENNIPVVGKSQVLNGREMHWMRVDRYFSGPSESPHVVAQPVMCVHCEMAPCESVCPVAATAHDEEGLNTMAYNRCIGTRYCANNCPYKVRRFNFFNFTKNLPEIVQLAMNPDVTVRSRGVMEKCTFCVQRIAGGKLAAKREGRRVSDGDITTACQQSCPTDAIIFGNINEPDSRVAKLKQHNRNYALLGELNLKPRGTYLAKLRNPNGDMPGAKAHPSTGHGASHE